MSSIPLASDLPDTGELQRFRSIVERIAAEIPPFLTEKHIAYGKNNLGQGSDAQGYIARRVIDKCERIGNMVANGVTRASGESLEDTCMDIIGYGFLSLMVARGEEI
jgi:hypothetical protein